MNAETRHQTIAIAAAIFAARDLANLKEPRELHSPRAISATRVSGFVLANPE